MFFLDAMHGWALGWPHLLRTTDGGTTWIPIGTDTLWGASSIQFLDTMNGWVAGNEIAAHTTDGGATWQRYDPHTYSNSMDFVDPAYGWVQGGCSVLRFDGSIFSAPDAPPPAPSSFALLPAYPNPFNSVTNLTFELPSASRAKVELFDISGRLVQTISDRQYTAGVHTIQFDAGPLPSGLYFARASSGEFHAVQKLVLLK